MNHDEQTLIGGDSGKEKLPVKRKKPPMLPNQSTNTYIFCLVKKHVRFCLYWIFLTSLFFLENFITHHSFYIILDAINGGTLWGMAITKAVSTNDKLVYCIVVFLFDFISGVQQVVPQSVKLGEIHSQVGDL